MGRCPQQVVLAGCSVGVVQPSRLYPRKNWSMSIYESPADWFFRDLCAKTRTAADNSGFLPRTHEPAQTGICPILRPRFRDMGRAQGRRGKTPPSSNGETVREGTALGSRGGRCTDTKRTNRRGERADVHNKRYSPVARPERYSRAGCTCGRHRGATGATKGERRQETDVTVREWASTGRWALLRRP